MKVVGQDSFMVPMALHSVRIARCFRRMEDLQNFVALSLPGGVHEDHDIAYVAGWRITTCLCSTHLEHSSHGGAEEGQLEHQYGITTNQDGFLYDCDIVNYKTYIF